MNSRVIEVESCHECPYQYSIINEINKSVHLCGKKNNSILPVITVGSCGEFFFEDNKEFPDWCPLRRLKQMITY